MEHKFWTKGIKKTLKQYRDSESDFLQKQITELVSSRPADVDVKRPAKTTTVKPAAEHDLTSLHKQLVRRYNRNEIDQKLLRDQVDQSDEDTRAAQHTIDQQITYQEVRAAFFERKIRILDNDLKQPDLLKRDVE